MRENAHKNPRLDSQFSDSDQKRQIDTQRMYIMPNFLCRRSMSALVLANEDRRQGQWGPTPRSMGTNAKVNGTDAKAQPLGLPTSMTRLWSHCLRRQSRRGTALSKTSTNVRFSACDSAFCVSPGKWLSSVGFSWAFSGNFGIETKK